MQGPQNIRLDLDRFLSSVWAAGHIAAGKLWEYYCQYVYLPRLAERSVLDRGIVAVFDQVIWDQDGFAVASGYDEASGQVRRPVDPQGNVPPQITDSALLVRPDRAIAQREQERAEQEAAGAAAAAAAAGAGGAGAGASTDSDTATGAGTGPGGGSSPGPVSASGGALPMAGPHHRAAAAPPAPSPVTPRFYGTVRLDPERFGRDLNRLYQKVIQHLAAPEGVDLEITVEISASKKDGYPDDKARIVTENAHTLKFDQYGFEDH